MNTETQIRQAFGFSSTTEGLLFVNSTLEAEHTQLRGQAHYIRRAFEQLRLNGILCIDGIPTVYLKQYQRPVGCREVNELQRQFWNAGTGTLLLILDPSFLYVFSSMMLPSMEEENITAHQALVERLDRVANTLEQYQLISRVASGQYYREHADKFQPANTVDRHLLSNLGALGDKLRHNETLEERKRVHSFLGRIVFTCYLIDRGIIKLQNYSFIRKKSVIHLQNILEAYQGTTAKNLLYQLFARLRKDFNGSMFDADLEEEKRFVSDDDLATLLRFLRGDDLPSGQMSLGFSAYDFGTIPVETISAIYEKFLQEEDPVEKNRQGAFYTPRHLAEMVVDEATSHLDSLMTVRCLDPACGSGIFLVILFNRIAEEVKRHNPRSQKQTRVNELLDVLENQICGVDVNKTACRITCFSLYIAFLDQFDPPTLIELQEKSDKLLPKFLAYKNDNYQNTETPVVYEGNFFDSDLPIRDDYDIIVGNPPWVGRNQNTDGTIKAWVDDSKSNPFLEHPPLTKTKQKAIFFPQNQIAHAFMWKTALHTNDSARICMLLPIQVLLNKTDAFQHAWFAKMEVYRTFNLSDFRWFLFQDADRPASIILFNRARIPLDITSNSVEYVVPKVRQQDPRSGLIKVFPDDRKWVTVEEILDASRTPDDTEKSVSSTSAAVFWKSLFWGTPRDVAFLRYLQNLDCLGKIAGRPEEGKRWIKGQGFKPWYQISFDAAPDSYGPPKPIPGVLDDPFIPTTTDSFQLFTLLSDTIKLRDRLTSVRCKGYSSSKPDVELGASLEGFHRSPDERLFNPPLVLTNKGFTKFSFVDFKTFYQHSLTGFCGKPEDANLLRFFTLFVSSNLAKYFFFHTAGSWGVERTEVRVHELMRLPFPLPESSDSHKDAHSIINQVAEQMERLQVEIASEYEQLQNSEELELQSQSIELTRKQRIDDLQLALEPLVYRYFKLTKEEIILINDTCELITESATPQHPDKRIPTTSPTTMIVRQEYAKLLCDTLNSWSEADQPKQTRPPFFFKAEIVPCVNIGVILISLSQARCSTSPSEVEADGRLETVIRRITSSTTYEQGAYEYLRGIILGNGDQIHILKPDMWGQWTRTMALNDADRIFHAIIQSKGK